jgi:hypothetical protein
MSEESAAPGNRPVDKVRVKNITASIWKNTGSKGDFYNATIENRYKDDDAGTWHTTTSYGASDLLSLETVAREAAAKIRALSGQ